MKFLDLEEKYMELAKMLSSDPPTDAALQNAKNCSLLKSINKNILYLYIKSNPFEICQTIY